MRLSKAKRNFTAWVAIFAILSAFLAPSISYAATVPKGSGASWIEICSVTGMKMIKGADSARLGKSSLPADGASHSGHCLLCFMHADFLGLPSTAAPALSIASGSQALPTLFYRAQHPLSAWPAAQPRAPPVFS